MKTEISKMPFRKTGDYLDRIYGVINTTKMLGGIICAY